MDFLFIDTGPSEIIRHLTTPPAAIVQPVEVAPQPVLLACYAYIEGSTPTSCPQTPRSPTGVTETGAGQSPDFNPLNEEGMDDTIFDEETEEELLCYVEQDEEREMDDAAQRAAEEIRDINNSVDNPNNLELGTFVLRLEDGSIVFASPTFGGSTGTVRLDQMLRDAQNEFGDINQSNIVGIVHLHPSDTGPGFVNVDNLNQLSALNFGSTFPSSRHTGGLRTHPITGEPYDPWDWAAGERFLTSGGLRTSVDDVSHYILGPDGVLREYSYSDPNPDAPGQSLQDRIIEAEKDAGSEC
ncbi:hypothetical protein [Litorimonas sp. WD9-15]|uniref:hypothetical protein n=1 Tax=Litorimonas sp. WD9-15 TaxID=3418716 RepID=UPI003D047D23